MDTHEQFDMREEASQPADGDLDRVLRPATFDDFTGQRAALDNLQIFVAAARQRGESLDHVLFHGPPGLGKTTMAMVLAHELGVKCRITSAPALERTRDIIGLLLNLAPNNKSIALTIKDFPDPVSPVIIFKESEKIISALLIIAKFFIIIFCNIVYLFLKIQ